MTAESRRWRLDATIGAWIAQRPPDHTRLGTVPSAMVVDESRIGAPMPSPTTRSSCTASRTPRTFGLPGFPTDFVGGDPTPSPDDLHLTAEALAAGRLLDIGLLDHLVIGHEACVSLRDRGVAFDRPVPVSRAADRAVIDRQR